MEKMWDLEGLFSAIRTMNERFPKAKREIMLYFATLLVKDFQPQQFSKTDILHRRNLHESILILELLNHYTKDNALFVENIKDTKLPEQMDMLIPNHKEIAWQFFLFEFLENENNGFLFSMDAWLDVYYLWQKSAYIQQKEQAALKKLIQERMEANFQQYSTVFQALAK